MNILSSFCNYWENEVISKECSHCTNLRISWCSILPAADCGLLLTRKTAGLWDNWQNHLDHTLISTQEQKWWENNNLKSSLILVSWQMKNIMATLPNMAFKIRQAFHLKGLRNGETMSSFFFLTWVSHDNNTFLSVTAYVYWFLKKSCCIKYEHSEIYNIIDNSRHCLGIKETWTGRPKIWATLSVWEKLVCASAFFPVNPEILPSF